MSIGDKKSPLFFKNPLFFVFGVL